MLSQVGLMGAGIALAVAALLYLFYYLFSFDNSNEQSRTGTSASRDTRTTGAASAAANPVAKLQGPDAKHMGDQTASAHGYTDHTLVRHQTHHRTVAASTGLSDAAVHTRARASTNTTTTAAAHSGIEDTLRAAAETRPHSEATAIKPDVSRTIAGGVATAATAHTTEHARGHTGTVAGTVAASDGARTQVRTGHTEQAAAVRTASVTRERDEPERRGGAPWFGWAAGLGTVLAALGLLAYNNKGEAVKQVVKAQAEEAQGAVADKLVPKVEAVVEAAKEKIAEVTAEVPVKVVAEVVLPKAEVQAEVKSEPEPEAAAPVAGLTSYYGVSDGSHVMAWSADASMNPDYAAADAAAPAEPEAQAVDAEGTAPVVEAAAEPAAEPAAAAPVSLGGVGVTSFYAIAETPDQEQAWAAEAEMNADYEAAEAAPEAAAEAAPEAAAVSMGGVGVTSNYSGGTAWAAPENYYAPADAVPGVTSLYASSGWVSPENYYAPVEVAAAPEPEAAPAATAAGVTSAYTGSGWVAPANYYAPVDVCSDSVAAALKSGKLNFATSSWEILDDSFPTLDKIAKLIKGCNGAAVEIGGHTDNTGTAEGNQVLSEQRAKAVVKYLTSAGVSAAQLKAVGYGQDRPIAGNTTAAGKRENRRIEFVVSAK